MTSQVLATIEPKMARAVEVMGRDLQGVRTGRASTALVERIHVDYYGTPTALNQLAGISVPEPHLIVIQPWDRGVLGAIEKAILKSDIGLTPNVDGTVVRLNIPPLTEERRRDLVKVVHRRMEEAKVEIRNLRREAADAIKREERDGVIGTDDAHRELEQLQRVTDRHVADVDTAGGAKEREVMEAVLPRPAPIAVHDDGHVGRADQRVGLAAARLAGDGLPRPGRRRHVRRTRERGARH